MLHFDGVGQFEFVFEDEVRNDGEDAGTFGLDDLLSAIDDYC